MGNRHESSESGYKRGSPRKVEVGTDGDRRIVYDANDILRDVTLAVIEGLGKTQQAAARAMGYAQPTLHAFLNGRPGKLDVLTGLCALTDSDPVDIFAEHPLFADSARSLVRPKDHLFRRFTAALRNRNADRLVRALEIARAAGRLDDVIDLVVKQVDLLGGDTSSGRNSAAKPAKAQRTRK